MALTAGARLGPYEILSAIGAGGMGEVYRATDTNLGRQVAIKVLPEAFATEAERLARFQRAAKTLAACTEPPEHCRHLRTGECRRHDGARHGTDRGPHARRSPRQHWRAPH